MCASQVNARANKNLSCKLDYHELKVTIKNNDDAILTDCRKRGDFYSWYSAAAGGKPAHVLIHYHRSTPPKRAVSYFSMNIQLSYFY